MINRFKFFFNRILNKNSSRDPKKACSRIFGLMAWYPHNGGGSMPRAPVVSMSGTEKRIRFGWQDAGRGQTVVPETGKGPPFCRNYKDLQPAG